MLSPMRSDTPNLPGAKSDITNDEFLRAIFGEQYIYAHVTSFVEDPATITSDISARCWAGGYYKDIQLMPRSNQFYTVSLFAPDDQGRSRRRKTKFSSCFVIGLDDVREKLPIEQVERLPLPSIVLKSSLNSEQWLYILSIPCVDINRIDNLHDGLIANGLSPDNKDPGQKGVTRYLRLPEGINTKAKRIRENNRSAPDCQIIDWHPELRYTLEELAKPFGVDIDAPRRIAHTGAAADIPGHPLLQSKGIHIKKALSLGRYEITCPWVADHTNDEDSGSAVFTNTDGSIGFKCHHGACDARNTGDLLSVVDAKDPGFKLKLKEWQLRREFEKIEIVDLNSKMTAIDSPLSKLLSMVADGSQMMKQMSEDKFVLKDLAIKGHWTVLYAGPNTGKTLLTQWLLYESIAAGEINGSDVFYLNVDDAAKSGAEKAIMAKEFGYHMLLSSVKGFKASEVLGLMKDLIVSGEVKDKVFVLDTLKKFTDLMDKKLSSSFGNTAREFVAAGGTLICLAHVNKHKGADGKSIYAGTSDIRDDADNVFTIEPLSNEEAFCKTTHTVEFQCSKSRGDVAQAVVFQYTKEKGMGYRTMFDSVKRLDSNDAKTALRAAKDAEQQKTDIQAIESIRAAITNGQSIKSDIESFIQTTGRISRKKARTVLEKYEGSLWVMVKGSHNKSIYRLMEPPIPSISCL